MVEQRPTVNVSENNRYQRCYYENNQKRTMQRVDSFYVRHKIDWMVRFSMLEKKQSVLEVGAGLGKFSVPLLRDGYDVTCLDLSPVMLEDMRRSVPDLSVETIASDVLEVGSATSKTFDRVIGFFVLHHFLDLDATFDALIKVMNPGAVVAFLEPAASNPLYYLQVTFTPGMTWRAERGLLNMRASRVLPAMGKAGLTDLESSSFGFFPPFLANTRLGGSIEMMAGDWHGLRPFNAFRLFRGRKPS